MAQEIRSEEIVLNENEIVCLLTNKIVKVTEKETNLQYMRLTCKVPCLSYPKIL